LPSLPPGFTNATKPIVSAFAWPVRVGLTESKSRPEEQPEVPQVMQRRTELATETAAQVTPQPTGQPGPWRLPELPELPEFPLRTGIQIPSLPAGIGLPSLPPGWTWAFGETLPRNVTQVARRYGLSWDDINFWRNIYEEIQDLSRALSPTGEAQPLGVRQIPLLIEAGLLEVVSLIRQLFEIGTAQVYQELRLNVTYLDMALGFSKLSGLKDAERWKKPALGGRTAFKPGSQVAQSVREGLTYVRLAQEIYVAEDGDAIARALPGSRCLVFNREAARDRPAFAVLRQNLDELIIVVRGSASVEDALTDLDALSTTFYPPLPSEQPRTKVNGSVELPLGFGRGSAKLAELIDNNVSREERERETERSFAHAGFASSATFIVEQISELLQDEYEIGTRRITLTGHSLGASVAQLVGIVLNRQLRFDVRVVAFGPAPCMSSALAEEANRFSLNFVNGFDIIPRFSMRTGQRAIAELVTTSFASAVNGTSAESDGPKAGFAWVQWGADLMRQTAGFKAWREGKLLELSDTHAKFIRNGTTELRLIRELMPLDYIHIGTRSDGVITYAKREGPSLLEIQFSRRGMVSDHIILEYRRKLRELDQQSQKSWAFRPRSRLRQILWRPELAPSSVQRVEDKRPEGLTDGFQADQAELRTTP